MTFEDDKPVKCTCGCTVYPDEEYYEVTIPIVSKGTVMKYENLTYCGDNDCFHKVVKDYLNIESTHVKTALDKYYEYGDLEREGDE